MRAKIFSWDEAKANIKRETRQKKELRAGGVALAEPAGEGGHKTAGLVV